VPGVVFAVNTGEVATPLALVVAVLTPPANVPLAPVCAGAVKVTVTPLVGVPPVVTVACSGVNAVLTATLCGVPPVAVINTVGGGGVVVVLELLLQLVRNVKVEKIKIEKTNAGTLQ
jgi:hypothetical protein